MMFCLSQRVPTFSSKSVLAELVWSQVCARVSHLFRIFFFFVTSFWSDESNWWLLWSFFLVVFGANACGLKPRLLFRRYAARWGPCA